MEAHGRQPFEPDKVTEGLDVFGRVHFRFFPAKIETICGRDGLMQVVDLRFEDKDGEEETA
jgi:hypothetical protein